MPDLAFGAVTDRGVVRSINEDSILAVPPVFVVADGIGGSDAGEVASAIVTEEFAALAERQASGQSIDPDDVGRTLTAAHDRVNDLHQGRPYGAGTTAVGAVAFADADEPFWVVFNIGDSRIYQRAAGDDHQLHQISVDHSHVQELVDAGVIDAEQARTHPDRNLVTRAIGSDEGFRPDYWVLPMVRGDRFVVCSDGLFGDTPAAELEQIATRADPPQIVADELLELALRYGARDNVSAIVVDVLGESGEGVPSPVATADGREPR